MSDRFKCAIGESVRHARKIAGKSQVELASDIGVSNVHLCNIERGHSLPSLATLSHIARACRLGLRIVFERPAP